MKAPTSAIDVHATRGAPYLGGWGGAIGLPVRQQSVKKAAGKELHPQRRSACHGAHGREQVGVAQALMRVGHEEGGRFGARRAGGGCKMGSAAPMLGLPIGLASGMGVPPTCLRDQGEHLSQCLVRCPLCCQCTRAVSQAHCEPLCQMAPGALAIQSGHAAGLCHRLHGGPVGSSHRLQLPTGKQAGRRKSCMSPNGAVFCEATARGRHSQHTKPSWRLAHNLPAGVRRGHARGAGWHGRVLPAVQHGCRTQRRIEHSMQAPGHCRLGQAAPAVGGRPVHQPAACVTSV